MKLTGIKIENTPKGKLKSITIKANTKTEFVEDLIDTIIYEAHKDDEKISFEDALKILDKKHNIKR
jgi:hypothetical protein